MGGVRNSALALLVVTGILLGLTPPFGKLASTHGVPPLLWALVISFGAGAVLLAGLAWRGNRLALDRRHIRYYVIVAIVSYALPIFSCSPPYPIRCRLCEHHVHPVSGHNSTPLISPACEQAQSVGVLGIIIGFIGALMVATTRGQAGHPADVVWVIVGLMIPMSLAVGNIYRTIDWPDGSKPLTLAAGSHLASAAMLIGLVLAYEGAGSVRVLWDVPLLVAAQIAASSAMFAFFFRLQLVGGPVYLSQIGYVAAAVGLVIGVVFLDESYALLTWLGAAIITLGVSITTKARGNS